jgi:hypothetical protein
MTGRITGMVQYGKSLAVLTESSIIVTHDNGKEPNEWPKEVFSDVGTNDEFVRQFADEFMELMGATSIFDRAVKRDKGLDRATDSNTQSAATIRGFRRRVVASLQSAYAEGNEVTRL